MRKKLFRVFAYMCALVLLLDIFSPLLFNSNLAVNAAGTKLPASSSVKSSTVATDYQVPQSVTEVEGPNNISQDVMAKIYSGNIKGKYWGQGLPFTIKDVTTGQEFAGYCAQSYTYASKKMEASGLISDPRIIKMVHAVTGGNVETPTDAQQIAVQIVLWGALNNNWSADLFSSGKISTNSADYGTMVSVGGHVEKAAAAWSDIISDTKPMAPIKLAKNSAEAVCHPEEPDTKGSIVAIPWSLGGGGNINSISEVADITYEGIPGEVLRGGAPGTYTKVQDFGLSPKGNTDYIILPPGTKGEFDVKIKVNYKDKYKPFNDMTLVAYNGGAANQPFILPKKGTTELKIHITADCKPKPPDDPEIPPSEATEEPIRWYNMPSAFGEIKNGVGFNNNGITQQGKYAQTRDQEHFEAMNGIPSTERFYVNLGGTEGFMDVTYKYIEQKHPFVVNWATPWVIPGDPGSSGTEYFSDTFTWTFRNLHFESATFRTFGDGEVNQAGLEIDVKVINQIKDPGSYVLKPNANGLEIGPGVGKDTYNVGATKSWAPQQGEFTTPTIVGRVSVKEDGKQEAYDKGNANVGNIFSQNDALEITIHGEKYVYVPEVNVKEDKPYQEGAEYMLDATDGKKHKYFKPIEEKWDVWTKVPIVGYNGNPEDDGERSIEGTPILLEDLPVPIRKANGIYEFQTDEEGNYLDYEEIVTTIKGPTEDLKDTVDELLDDQGKGKSTGYGSPKDPHNKDYYLKGNTLLLQYTNWQVPIDSGDHGLQFKHSTNEPDMNKGNDQGDNPTYRSINPVLIHNPTTALYSWISDIPDSQLQDQRIDAGNERFSKHERTQSGNPRQYIDYDFQLTIPNAAAFETYWSQAAGNSQDAGFEDPDFTNPGTIGKGYVGSAAGQVTERSYSNPYGSADGWDVSKWTSAKYVKFPYNVYYYKNSGESGGDDEGFYEAGTWIKLYDDNHTVQVGDPTTFNFHVTSDQKDVKDGIIYITSEVLNSQPGVESDPDALYVSGEQYVNGTRNEEGSNLGVYATGLDGEAIYSAVNQINVDAIGRIGNLLVSDITDPAWADVFWKTNNGKVDTTTPVHKDYGIHYNIYESKLFNNATGFPAFNRYMTLDEWHGYQDPRHTLPVTTNVFTKGKEDQTAKLGYTVGGSIQTIGDYDYSMWIYPQNQLAGKFATGNAGQHFKLITSDPFKSGAKYQEYYDSNVNNTLHGNGGILGKDYSAPYQHILSLSLANPRMKMSSWEKRSASYQTAVQQGASKKTITGTPSWVVIPRSLRTLAGKDESQGRWGLSGENGNNGSGSKSAASSADCACSYENVQKWNWNYSLPQNTKIWFDQNPANTGKSGSPKFEAATKNQYIITSMAYRTKTNRTTFPGEGDEWQLGLKQPAITYGDNYLVSTGQSIPDWDLTMYTNTGANGLPDIQGPTKNVPDGITPNTDPSVPNTWDPTQEGDIGAPMLDIIWWNYSKPATTDKDNIGTH